MELSADEKARKLYEARLKERRDSYAREKGAVTVALKSREFEIAQSLLSMAMPVDQISTATGLTFDEIESLRNTE